MVIRIARNFVFERSQLRAVFQHLSDQTSLRLDRLPLLENQHGQDAVGNDEQNHQERQNGYRPRLNLRSCSLRAVNNGQGGPRTRPCAPGFARE